jgi:hypothetical protein
MEARFPFATQAVGYKDVADMTIRAYMKRDRALVLIAAILALSMTTQASSQLPPATAPGVAGEATRIQNDPDPASRYEALRRLVVALHQDSSGLGDRDVIALMALLRDSSDLVRDRAAVALGLIGPRALRAVPALQTALSEVECVRADQNSSSAIAVALRRIGIAPDPPECIATPYYGLKRRLRGSDSRSIPDRQ